MLKHDKEGPYWLITDARHSRRCLRTFAMDPRANKTMAEAGILVKAPTGPGSTIGPVLGLRAARAMARDG